MKKLNLLLVLTFLCLWANAQYQILVKRGSETLVYDKIETVFAELQNNDTLYLPARTFVPANRVLETDKKVHIIGAGYHKGAVDTLPVTILDASLYLLDGADGSSIEGVRMASLILGKDAATADVDNVTLKRCKFMQNVVLGVDANVQHVQFNECVFISWVEAKNASYLTFRNCFFNSQLRYTSGNTLLDHCHIEGQCNYNKGLTISNSFLEQGGSIGGTNQAYTLINCAFHTTDPAAYFKNSPNQVSNCIGPVSWTETFVDCPVDIYTNGYDSHHDYRVKAGSLAKNAGSDGTDIGLFGGANPFKEGCFPSNPRIVSAVVAPETNAEGKLNISIKVEAFEN